MKYLPFFLLLCLISACADDSEPEQETEYDGPIFSFINERDPFASLLVVTDRNGELLDSVSTSLQGTYELKIEEENQIVTLTIMDNYSEIVSYFDIELSELKYWWDNSTTFTNGVVRFSSELSFENDTKTSMTFSSGVDFSMTSASNLNNVEVALSDERTIFATKYETGAMPLYARYADLNADDRITLAEEDFTAMEFKAVSVNTDQEVENFRAKLFGYNSTTELINLGNDLINKDIMEQQGLYFTGDRFDNYSSTFLYNSGGFGYKNYYPDAIPSSVKPLVVENIDLNKDLESYSLTADGSFQLMETIFATDDFGLEWFIYGNNSTTYNLEAIIAIAKDKYSKEEVNKLNWAVTTFIEKEGYDYEAHIERISYPLENGAWDEAQIRTAFFNRP